MRASLSAAVLVVAVACALGAERRSVVQRVDRSLALSPDALASYLNLGEGAGFTERARARTAKGHARSALKQTYGGLEVLGSLADVEVTDEGLAAGTVSGTLAFDLPQDIPDVTACARDTNTLMQRAVRYLVEEEGIIMPTDEAPEGIHATKKLYLHEDSGHADLVYELVFLLHTGPKPIRPFFIIDACSEALDIIVYFDKIHNATRGVERRHFDSKQNFLSTRALLLLRRIATGRRQATDACPASQPAVGDGGNLKTGRIHYGIEQPLCLATWVQDNNCIMASRHAIVVDMQNTKHRWGKDVISFPCSEGHSDPTNGAYGVASDVFYFGHATGALYEDWYHMRALPFTPEFRIHYGYNNEGAYWDGGAMMFGDGGNENYPMVSADIVGHELAHGLTERLSGLYYRGQSGGINEAFSDMSGEIAEFYMRNSNDWELAQEVVKENDRAIRYMKNPKLDGESIDHASEYKTGMNVHFSSGVFNKAFYLLVKEGVPIRQAYEIFLVANQEYWHQETDFVSGACGARKAAYDLGYSTTILDDAFRMVGISTEDCSLEAIQQVLLPGEVRRNVLVSKWRSPVFTLELEPGQIATISTVVSSGDKVEIHLTSDIGGQNVVGSRTSPLLFIVSENTHYFKLTSTSRDDISVALEVTVF